MSIHVGSQISEDLSLDCDVCIVGSGAGGAVVAQRLATAGKRVIVLEDGGFHQSARFDLTERNMFRRLYQEGGARATADQSMAILQGRAVGGTTVINWTTCFRTPERVMTWWAEHHGVEGLTHEALVPHWERIEQRLNVQQMRLDQVNANNMMTWRGLEALGWHKDLLFRNVKNCAHTGYCGMGCVIDAKQSMLVTFIPEAVNAGADVYANAWVERVEIEGRHVTGVIAKVRDPLTDRFTGRTITVRPRITVLSGGAINTPALLLRSELDPSGRTGKRTFFHPALGAVGVHAARVNPFVGSPQYVYSDQFVEPEPGKMGFLLEGAPMFPMSMGGLMTGLGAERQAALEVLPYSALTGALLHDGFDPDDPDEGATITLQSGGRPKIDYKWTERLQQGVRDAMRATMQIQLAAGAEQVFSSNGIYVRSEDDIARWVDHAPFRPGDLPLFVAHCMGGCAMGIDPHRSVVDSRSLRHHALDDLFVIDGSVFPTACSVNPQISIYGLASWGADHVAEALG
jgi:choline dehydrogenase-like flavoprotein